jgi:CubicO group peptidase (beta-lactamase class C family)
MLRTTLKQISCGFLIILVGLSASCSGSIFPNTLEARIDKYMQMYHSSFSGTIFVAQKGKVLSSQGYGLADRELNVPNTPQIKYAIGSMSKSFTAMAIMILQDHGQLTVQDPICNYLADCPSAWKPITLHHLLTHTSGIHNYTDLYPKLKDEVNICREYKPEEVIAYFKDLPLDFAPGSGWSYSNSGYFLLGVVIEKVSGESYETFIQKNILQPLGMSESGYDRSSTIVKNRASGYSINRPYYDIVNAPCYDVSLKFAHGGLYSTVGDLYKWDQALYANQLVSQETLNTIFTSTVSIPGSNGLYGYGWMISQQSGHRVIEHSGNVYGFVADLARYPDDQVVIIVLSNTDWEKPDEISRNLANIVLGGK